MHVNNDFQKNSNISQIFNSLWHNNRRSIDMSRIDIAKELNIYRSTVSNVVQVLLDNNVIKEGIWDSVKDTSGRKPISLSINPDFGCILGIELQPDSYNICICNFDGTVIFTKSGITEQNTNCSSEENFTAVLQTIIDTTYPEIEKINLPLLSICVGIPGIVDTDKGVIVSSEPFGLNNFPYPVDIAKKYKVPLLFENDAKCCAWYIKSETATEKEQDYLCVLTKNHDTQGISIGMSLTLNGRVINGHNHAVGEYVSNSWSPYKTNQTGLAQAILNTVNSIEDSYREWIIDLFSTITTFIPLLEPETVYLFGQGDKKELIIDTINKDVEQFNAILNRCQSTLKILENKDSVIANGAALMFVQKLIEIPSLKENSISKLSWDEVFKIQRK